MLSCDDEQFPASPFQRSCLKKIGKNALSHYSECVKAGFFSEDMDDSEYEFNE